MVSPEEIRAELDYRARPWSDPYPPDRPNLLVLILDRLLPWRRSR